MKKIVTALMMIVGFVVFAFQSVSLEPVARISYYVGDVYVIKKENRNMLKVKVNNALLPGDRIETKGESRCEITYNDGSVIRLDQFTLYKIKEQKTEEKEEDGGLLAFGSLWANIVKLVSGGEAHNVKTPTAVAAIRGTVYEIKCDSIQSTFKVFEGGINVTPEVKDSTEKITTFAVNYGEEFILVNNFEEYRKKQEKAFEEFQMQQQKAFENFMEQDQKQFEEFVRKDLGQFQKFNEFHVLLDKFDLEKEKQNDWVKWNMERDKALNR